MDRVGTKRCLIAGCIVSSLALFGIGFLGNSYGMLLFFLGVQGIGDSFYYSGAQGTIAFHTPPERKAIASALLAMGMAIGTLLGLAFSYELYSAFESYRIPFLFVAVVKLVVTGLIARFAPNVSPSAEKTDARDYLALFRDVNIWRISVATFFLMYGFWVMVNWGPTFLEAERGFVAEQAGFYSGLIALASIPGGLLWGRLSNRIGRKPVVMISLLINGFSLFAIAGIGSSYLWIVLSLLAFGLCANSAIIPVVVVWVGRIAAERYPGKMVGAIAFFNCLIVSSAIVAPVVSGFIRDVTGSLSGSIYLAAAAAIVSPLLLLGLEDKK